MAKGVLWTPLSPGTITFPVYVHVITSNTGEGYVSDVQIKKQIEVLNDAFAGSNKGAAASTSFQFVLVGVDRTANDACSFDLAPGTTQERDENRSQAGWRRSH